jgi:glutathione synthase/RimK-type ligase-like ATP-grasp enzyme
VVIDDPESILKCSNKVYLAELLNRHKIPTPYTLIVHRDNLEAVPEEIGLPCILKQPDSSFSQGVIKVDDVKSLEEAVDRLLERSEFVIAQEYMPTPYDWRIGILDRQVLFVCKYHMAGNHWQIVKRSYDGKPSFGKVDTIPLETAPKDVVQMALKAANLIGDGLYGVDMKVIHRKPYVIEVNENPNIDAGVEDLMLGDSLYDRIMQVIYKRIEAQKGIKPE